MSSAQPVDASGTFSIGGDLPVQRLGYGAMQILGEGRWGMPDDPANAIAVLRRAVELGVDFIDTADSYGPFVSEDLIREALHPYGHVRSPPRPASRGRARTSGPSSATRPTCGSAPRCRCAGSGSRRSTCTSSTGSTPTSRSRTSSACSPIWSQQGKVRHVGLSEVTVAELQAAQEILPIATVQNLYNVANRQSEALLEHCDAARHRLHPVVPGGGGEIAAPGGPLAASRPHRRDARRSSRSPGCCAAAR